jgi:hypothetical protein
MDYIIVEINGVRHKLVKDNMYNACTTCSKCTLRFMCGGDDICSSLGKKDCHFEIE